MSRSQWPSSGLRRGVPARPDTKSPSQFNIPDRDIKEGLSENSLPRLDKPTPFPKDIYIKDLEYVGSYNWVEAIKPTIIIPGMYTNDDTTMHFVIVRV